MTDEPISTMTSFWRSAPLRGGRGRWMAVWYEGERSPEATRAIRFRSLSRARRYARARGGFVQRHRANTWRPVPRVVARWTRGDLAIAITVTEKP